MKAKPAVIITTVYIILYYIAWNTGFSLTVCSIMFLLFPVIIVGMVYFVLKDTSVNYPELAKGEEWGYRDKTRMNLVYFE